MLFLFTLFFNLLKFTTPPKNEPVFGVELLEEETNPSTSTNSCPQFKLLDELRRKKTHPNYYITSFTDKENEIFSTDLKAKKTEFDSTVQKLNDGFFKLKKFKILFSLLKYYELDRKIISIFKELENLIEEENRLRSCVNDQTFLENKLMDIYTKGIHFIKVRFLDFRFETKMKTKEDITEYFEFEN